MLSETDVGGLDRFLAGSGKESSRVNGHNGIFAVGTMLGDPQRVWWSDGKPSVEGQIVEWRVNNHGKAVGRDVYVGSSGATAGIATSCLYSR